MVLQKLGYCRIALPRLNSGVGILPAIESTLENRKLEALMLYLRSTKSNLIESTLENRKPEAYATLILKLELGYCPSRRISALLRTICA